MQRIGDNGAVYGSKYSFIDDGGGADGVDASVEPNVNARGDTFDQSAHGTPTSCARPPRVTSPEPEDDLAPLPTLAPPPTSSASGQGAQPTGQGPSVRLGPVTINGRVPQPPPPVSTGTQSSSAAATVEALVGNAAQTASLPSPREVAESARSRGMRASVTHGSSLRDISRMINHGALPIALIDTGEGSSAKPAYVTISGYGADASGRINSVTVTDVNGKQTRMPVSEFEKRWSGVEVDGHTSDRTLISTLPKGNRPLRGVDGTMRSASSIPLPKQNPDTASADAQEAPDVGSVFKGIFKGIGDFFNSVFGALFKAPTQQQE